MDNLAAITHENLKLSKNKIEVNIEAYDPNLAERKQLEYALKLFTPEGYLSGTYTELIELAASEVPPHSEAGVVIFEGAYIPIEQYLDSFLSYSAPKFGQNKITVCEDLTTSYYGKAIVKNNGLTVVDVEAGSSWVLKGAIDERDFEAWRNKLFTHTEGLAYKFLTWKPQRSLIQPEQPEFLYFLTNFSPLPRELKLRVTLNYADGSSWTKTVLSVGGIIAYTVYCVPVGVAIVGADTDAKEVDSYQIWLSNENYERVSDVRKYVIDKRYHRNVRYLLYSNSLGGFDSLALLGKSTESLSVNREESERYVPFGAGAMYSENIVNRVTGERSLQVFSGHITTEEVKRLEDLLFAQEVFLVSDREHIPLRVASKGLASSVDNEFVRGRELFFVYANKQYGFSDLPPAPAEAARPTEWRVFGTPVCLLDARGIRNGLAIYPKIQEYYIDNGRPVVPVRLKNNTANTDGYIGPVASVACLAETTPFFSTEINREINFSRNTCSAGYWGTVPFVVISAGAYGSEISQNDADTKAENAWVNMNNQTAANELGECMILYYSAEIRRQSTFFKNDCGSGFGGTAAELVVAAGAYNSRLNQADADAKAEAAWATLNTQAKANELGSCTQIYYSAEIRRQSTFARNDCGAGFLGNTAEFIVSAAAYTSIVSQADANAKAEAAWAALNTQANVNQSAICSKIYYSVAVSRWSVFVKNDCTGGTTINGGKWLINVAAGAYSSIISQADADAKAVAQANSLDTQANANVNVKCYTTIDYYYPCEIAAGRWYFKCNRPIRLEASISGSTNCSVENAVNSITLLDSSYVLVPNIEDFVETVSFNVYANGLMLFSKTIDSSVQPQWPLFDTSGWMPSECDKVYVEFTAGL